MTSYSIQNLIFLEVNNAALYEHFLERLNFALHKYWMLLMQYYVGNVNGTGSSLHKLLLKLKEATFNFFFYILG